MRATCAATGTPGTSHATRCRAEAEKIHHPSTLPAGTARWCIRPTGVRNPAVLDVRMGTGTTLLAAALEGGQGIRIRLDSSYQLSREQRLETMQGRAIASVLHRLSPGHSDWARPAHQPFRLDLSATRPSRSNSQQRRRRWLRRYDMACIKVSMAPAGYGKFAPSRLCAFLVEMPSGNMPLRLPTPLHLAAAVHRATLRRRSANEELPSIPSRRPHRRSDVRARTVTVLYSDTAVDDGYTYPGSPAAEGGAAGVGAQVVCRRFREGRP